LACTGAAFAGMIEVETRTRKAKENMKFDRMVINLKSCGIEGVLNDE
jgi:hypothetical protein